MKAIIPAFTPAPVQALFDQAGIDTIRVADQKAATLRNVGAEADGIVLLTEPFPNQLFEALPNLKIAARFGVGYDNIDVAAAADHGVWVTNTPAANSVTVAESAVADLLLLSKNLYNVSLTMHQDQPAENNAVPGPTPQELAGKTIGIVGFGHIGQAVARMLSGFGVHVLIYNRTHYETTAGTYVDWETLFKQADFVMVHLAATPQTVGSIGAREFKLMKSSAMLINFARGTIVDEPALIEALTAGDIAGAGLDVFAKEPLPSGSLLRQMPNVFITPHSAANSQEAFMRMATDSAQEVIRVLTGGQPQWPLNRPN